MEHVVVIGAGPGLGSAICRHAAHEGARITAIARTASTIDPLIQELTAGGFDAAGFLADAAYEPQLNETLERVVAERDAPTLVVYNAVDPGPPGTPSALDPEFLTVSLETNVTGAVVTVSSLLEPMRQAGGGTIVLTGGILATRPHQSMTALSIGKAALRTYAACLHQELAGDDAVNAITVTVGGVIRPGGAFDPAAIAGRIWHAHKMREQGINGEITYAGPKDRVPAG
jgi:NAD(P)-dependent dehydrogenase (short-subunit alcohol dehydrogenase family)